MTVRIGQLTDIHVHDWADLRLRDFATKRLTGYVNYRYLRASQHTAEVLDAAVRRLVEEAPDIVLVTGDLTNLGFRSELVAARASLEPLVAAGIPVRAIPGNHDYYVRSSSRGLFEETLADLQDRDAGEPGAYPFVVRVGPVSCLLLNSAIPTIPLTAYGRIGRKQLKRLESLAESERGRGQHLLIALHHHPIRAPHKRWELTRDLKDARRFRRIATRLGADLVIHGHNHYAYHRRIGGGDGPLVLGLSSSSTRRDDRTERRGEIGLYTFDDAGLVEASTSPWDGQGFGAFEALDLDAIAVTSR